MDQQKPKQKNAKKTDKSLLRLQNPIYELRKNNQGQTQFVVRKNMTRKQPKPKIQALTRSPLLSQLEAVMPMFKKSNQDLNKKPIEQSQKIDAKLEEVQSSSSSESQDSDECQKQQNLHKILMKENQKQNQMLDEKQQNSQGKNEIQLNFLRYPVPIPMNKVQNKQSQEKTQQINKKIIQQIQ